MENINNLTLYSRLHNKSVRLVLKEEDLDYIIHYINSIKSKVVANSGSFARDYFKRALIEDMPQVEKWMQYFSKIKSRNEAIMCLKFMYVMSLIE